MEIFIESIGWIGTFFVVLAYFLVSNNKVSSGSKNYQLLNILGAFGIGINVFYHGAWPSFVLQIIWAIIGIYSLIKIKK